LRKRGSELPYLFNRIHPRTIIFDSYCTNPALMVLVFLPVTVEFYQTNVGRKTTASIPVWRMMMMNSFVNFWIRQADEHSKFEFRSQTGMFWNQKRILSNIWSGYTIPHPFLRKSSRCKFCSREESAHSKKRFRGDDINTAFYKVVALTISFSPVQYVRCS